MCIYIQYIQIYSFAVICKWKGIAFLLKKKQGFMLRLWYSWLQSQFAFEELGVRARTEDTVWRRCGCC